VAYIADLSSDHSKPSLFPCPVHINIRPQRLLAKMREHPLLPIGIDNLDRVEIILRMLVEMRDPSATVHQILEDLEVTISFTNWSQVGSFLHVDVLLIGKI
jgi:hypothetical protein